MFSVIVVIILTIIIELPRTPRRADTLALADERVEQIMSYTIDG